MIRKVSGGYVVFSEKGKKLSKVYKSKTEAKKRLEQIEYFKYKNQKYNRKVDRKMRAYGEIDYDKKLIRVNPAKGDLINTIIHEELHRKFPDKDEKWIEKRSEQREKSLTLPQAAELIKKYMNK